MPKFFRSYDPLINLNYAIALYNWADKRSAVKQLRLFEDKLTILKEVKSNDVDLEVTVTYQSMILTVRSISP